MAARLTDKQKKKIIADDVECGSYNETARMNGVSRNTVKNIIMEDKENATKCQQKKEQNTQDMLAYMDSRKAKAQEIIDKCLESLPGKLKGANATQTATVLGIISDKFLGKCPGNASVTIINDIPKVLANMNAMADIVKHPVPNRDISDYE